MSTLNCFSFLDVSMEDAVDTIGRMMVQERTTYAKTDYLANAHQVAITAPSAQVDPASVQPCSFIDSTWRQRIIEWMFGVVDHCYLRRDSVTVAAYLLDLCVARGLVACRQDFQLVAMTALQLAIKLYDSTVIRIDSMIKLGRGLFLEQDVIEMEKKMLDTLSWYVHPPTPTCFLAQFQRLLPNTLSSVARYMITEVTRFISEISVCLYRFIEFPPSTIAYAGMLVALDGMTSNRLPEWQRQQIYTTFASTLNLHRDSLVICQLMHRIEQSLTNNPSVQHLISAIDQQCGTSSDCKSFNNTCNEEYCSMDDNADDSTSGKTTSKVSIRSPRVITNG